MAETLFIRMADGDVAQWAAFDATGAIAGSVGQGSLTTAAAAAQRRRCCVLAPGVDVTSAVVDLPAAGPARLRQVVPFSLEESLADDVEQLSFAIGPRRVAGGTPVAVAAKQRIDAWLARLRLAGIAPEVLCSEADGVANVPGTLVLLIESGRIYGRFAERTPFVLEGVALREALMLARPQSDGESAKPHLLVYAQADDVEHVRRDVDALVEQFAGVDIKIAADGVFMQLAAALAQSPGTNLLQGAYAPKSNWLAFARPWRLAAGLAVTPEWQRDVQFSRPYQRVKLHFIHRRGTPRPTSLAELSNERIAVVAGSSHAYALRRLALTSPDLHFVEDQWGAGFVTALA